MLDKSGCGVILVLIGILLGVVIATSIDWPDDVRMISPLSKFVTSTPPNDIIQFSSNSNSFNTGVLVDGERDGSVINDEQYAALPGANITGFYFTNLPGEVIGFAQNFGSPPFPTSLPPTLKTPSDPTDPLAWTAGMDRISFTFGNEYLIDVSIWILFDTFGDDFVSQQTMALEAIRKTIDIWTTEGQGIRFRNYSINNRTTDTDDSKTGLVDKLSNLENSLGCSDVGLLRDNDRYSNGVINIYYVPRVQSTSEGTTGANSGTHCPGPLANPYHVILMGTRTNPDLFAHEIGHALSLEHVDPFTMDFDQTNVMHSASTSRQYLTEGQTFRSVVNTGSALNDPIFYNARPGLPQRGCSNVITPKMECPEIQKRIWTP